MPSKDLETPMDIKLYEAAKKGDVDSFIGTLENISQENKRKSKKVTLEFMRQPEHGIWEFLRFSSESISKSGLYFAVEAGMVDAVKTILNSITADVVFQEISRMIPAQIHVINEDGQTPLFFTVSTAIFGRDNVVRFILQTPYLECLINVIDDDEEGNRLFDQIKCLCHVNEEGKSGLYFAVEAGMVDAVKTILNSITADGNLKHMCELTNGKSLINAATRTSTVMLQEISRMIPAQIHVINEDGQTPLFFTVSTGFLEGLNCLLDEFNMDITQKDSSGHNLVHIASKSGHAHILQKLMQYFPDAGGFVNREVQLILHIAAIFGRDNVARFILQTPYLECLINVIDDDGNTPLYLATINNIGRVRILQSVNH
nr:hypothetical protein [Tanacetum cinerariifolium]